MKFPFRILPAFLLVVTMPGCILPPVSSTGGSSASALGPDGVQQESKLNTLSNRITSGLTWLWQSYSALKDRGLDVSSLREAIGEMQDVASKGDMAAALSLYGKARAIVTEISQ